MHGCLMNGFWLSALTRNVKKIINLSSEVPEIILYYYYLIFFSSTTHTSIRSTAQTNTPAHSTLFFSFKLMSFSFLLLSSQINFADEAIQHVILQGA